MAGDFVKLVEFQATGLEKIDTGLRKVAVTSESAITSGKKYQKVIDQTLRTMPSMNKIFEQGVRVQKEQARVLADTVRVQERITREVKTQAAMSGGRMGGLGAMAAGAGRAAMGVGRAIGGPAAAVGAAGFAAGVAGLSGTVPMARMSAAADRVAYELGNSLTPSVNLVTKGLTKLGNWLSGLSEGQQNVLGGGLLAGAAVIGGNALSQRVLGTGLGGAGRSAIAGVSALGGPAPAAPIPMTAAETSYRNAYGSRGLPSATGGGGGEGGSRLGRGGGRLFMGLAALELGSNLYQASQGTLQGQKYARGELTANETNPLAAEYEKKFGGLSGEGRTQAIQSEITKQKEYWKNKEGREAYAKAQGGMSFDPAISTGFRLESTKRAAYLEESLKSGGQFKGKDDHRANALIGGDFGEIGTGYYSAMSGLAKTGYDSGAGGGGGYSKETMDRIGAILEEIKNKYIQTPLK